MKPTIPTKEKLLCFLIIASSVFAVSLEAQSPLRGSITEDRKAKKLLEAGDSRMEADEKSKALEIWRTVLDQFPRSKVRFEAHMRIGEYLLTSKGAFDEARKHFESAAEEENRDDAMRAQATLKQGVCFYEARLYGKCFKVFRKIIEDFPASEEVNRAYYYIGLGHFKQGHYSRAIESLEKVGTAFSEKEKGKEKVEAGKRLFVKIEDADLAILAQEDAVEVLCKTKRGDEETLFCRAIGRNARIVLGSISTQLGRVKKGNGVLEVGGGDSVEVLYLDKHTAKKEFGVKRLKQVQVVGQGKASIMDGSYRDTLNGVVLGKIANLQVNDPDWDVSPKADRLKVTVEVRRNKTPEEIDEEIAGLVASGAIDQPAEGEEAYDPFSEDGDGPKIDKFKTVDSVVVHLEEAVIDKAEFSSPSADSKEEKNADGNESKVFAEDADSKTVSVPAELLKDDSTHSGVFRGVVSVENQAEVKSDAKLQALPGDLVRIVYLDKLNVSEDERKVISSAKCIEGNAGGYALPRRGSTTRSCACAQNSRRLRLWRKSETITRSSGWPTKRSPNTRRPLPWERRPPSPPAN